MTEVLGRPSATPHEGGVYIQSYTPGPYREGPAWIWLEKKDAAALADGLENLDIRRDADAHDLLFRVGVDAEGKTWALSVMRFRRYDEWWVQLNTGWNGKPNHGSVQLKGTEAAWFAQSLRQVTA